MARASMPIVLIAMCCLTACQTTPVDKTDEQASVALTDLKTSAKPDGNGYIVNGTKVFSTFSPEAAIFLVYVRYGPGVGVYGPGVGIGIGVGPRWGW